MLPRYILFLVLFQIVYTGELPNYFSRCTLEEFNSGCAVDAANKVLPTLLEGDQSLGIADLLPFKLGQVNIAESNFNITIDNSELHGLDSIHVTGVKWKSDSFTVNFTVKSLSLTGRYRKVDVFQEHSDKSGRVNFTINNAIILLEDIQDVKVEIEAESVSSKFVEDSGILSKSIYPAFEKAISEAYKAIVSIFKILKNHKQSEIFKITDTNSSVNADNDEVTQEVLLVNKFASTPDDTTKKLDTARVLANKLASNGLIAASFDGETQPKDNFLDRYSKEQLDKAHVIVPLVKQNVIEFLKNNKNATALISSIRPSVFDEEDFQSEKTSQKLEGTMSVDLTNRNLDDASYENQTGNGNGLTISNDIPNHSDLTNNIVESPKSSRNKSINDVFNIEGIVKEKKEKTHTLLNRFKENHSNNSTNLKIEDRLGNIGEVHQIEDKYNIPKISTTFPFELPPNDGYGNTHTLENRINKVIPTSSRNVQSDERGGTIYRAILVAYFSYDDSNNQKPPLVTYPYYY